MTYTELLVVYDNAWQAFYDVLEDNGIDSSNKLHNLLNAKDCLNDVLDCVVEVADLECEE